MYDVTEARHAGTNLDVETEWALMDTEYENIAVEERDRVTWVRMESTSRFNSLNLKMGEELFDVAVNLSEDDSVRCIVLVGSEGVFNSGADLSSLDGNENDAPTLRKLASLLHDVIEQLSHAPKPVITGVNGVAAGAGFSLAVSGDLVVVSEDARFEYAYPRIGLTGDGGSTYFLPRLVGLRRAKEIALLDEPIEPAEAVDLGLATEAVPSEEFEERLEDLSSDLATKPTKAYGALKQLLNMSFDNALSEQMAAETDAIARMTYTQDFEKGYSAFFTDEDPDFEGK